MFTLPDGTRFDPYRSRSEGVLTEAEKTFCENYAIALGYDPAQMGWVTMVGEDDVTTAGGEHDLVLDVLADHRRRLARKTARLLDECEQAELSYCRARALAFDEARALVASPLAASVDDDDRCRIALLREAVRFFPEPRGPRAQRIHPEFRAWEPSDAEAYRRIFDNPRVWQYLPEQAPEVVDRETAEAMIELAAIGKAQRTEAILVDGEAVGQVRLLFERAYPGLRVAEIAYLLGEDYWGRGWMTDILSTYTRQAARQLGLDALVAWIRPENEGSVRCAERAGYERDEFLREAALAELVGRPGFQRYVYYTPAPGPAVAVGQLPLRATNADDFSTGLQRAG